MHRYSVLTLMALSVVFLFTRQAQAIPQFQKEFITLYVGEDKTTDFAKVVRQAGCFVCHQGKLRKNHNPYGIHLVDLLDKKADMKNPAKIVEALKKIESLHSIEGDEKSPTYADVIKEGKLPGGPLEDAKKEPAAK